MIFRKKIFFKNLAPSAHPRGTPFFGLWVHLSKIASVCPLIQPNEASMPNFSSFGLSNWPGLWVWFEICLHILYLEDFCTFLRIIIFNAYYFSHVLNSQACQCRIFPWLTRIPASMTKLEIAWNDRNKSKFHPFLSLGENPPGTIGQQLSVVVVVSPP